MKYRVITEHGLNVIEIEEADGVTINSKGDLVFFVRDTDMNACNAVVDIAAFPSGKWDAYYASFVKRV